MAGPSNRRRRLLRFTTTVSESEEMFDRWKYWITGITAVAALAIMTAVVTVKITSKIREEDAAFDERLSQRSKYVLSEIASNINPSVDPCNDFYEYACGSFPKRYPLKDGKTRASYHTFYADRVYERIVNRLQGDELLSNDTLEPLKFIKRFWDACVNDKSDAGEQFKDMQKFLKQLNDKKKWEQQFALIIQGGYNMLFNIKMSDDYGYQKQLVIGAPDSGIVKLYSSNDSDAGFQYFSDLHKLLVKHTTVTFQHDPQFIIGLQLTVKSLVPLPSEKGREPLTSLMTVKKLSQITRINWMELVKGISPSISENSQVIVDNLEYLKSFDKATDRRTDSLMSDYFKLMLVEWDCFFMGQECRDLQYKFFQESKSNNSHKFRDKKEFQKTICFDTLAKRLEDVMFTVYRTNGMEGIDPSFYRDLIKKLGKQINRTVDEFSWMDEKTKVQVRESINSVSKNIEIKSPSYVDDEEDMKKKYAMVAFPRSEDEIGLYDDFLGINSYARMSELELGEREFKPWPISLFSTLPYVAQGANYVFVPDYFLNGPFAAPDLPAQIKFGFFASMVSHEMIHAVDGVADYYDSINGVKFWSKKTREKFTKKMKCLVDAYEEAPSDWLEGVKNKINGTHSLNENLADLIGLNVAFEVYKERYMDDELDTSELPDLLKNQTDDRLFFLAYANVHCINEIRNELTNSEANREPNHKFIVNVPLAHTPQFAKAFKCKRGSRMNPVKKCSFR